MNILTVPPAPGMVSPEKRILVHICCAPDAVYILQELRKGADVCGFFYNPNIYPEEEYQRRKRDTEKICDILNVPLIIGEYDAQQWENAVRELHQEPEGGARCRICYRYRLLRTAEETGNQGMDGFTAVLTVSPHKNADIINEIGIDIERETGICYIPSNFKKKEGFKHSVRLSREYGLYRQNYCGCRYSITRQDETCIRKNTI